jgi:hypothetical protein
MAEGKMKQNKKHALDRVVFKGFTLHSVFKANSRLAKVVSAKFVARLWFCAVLCETTKQVVNLSVHRDDGHPSTRILKILETEASTAQI